MSIKIRELQKIIKKLTDMNLLDFSSMIDSGFDINYDNDNSTLELKYDKEIKAIVTISIIDREKLPIKEIPEDEMKE